MVSYTLVPHTEKLHQFHHIKPLWQKWQLLYTCVGQPALSAIDILTAAGVDINIDNLEATHDGKAPLELVGSVRRTASLMPPKESIVICVH